MFTAKILYCNWVCLSEEFDNFVLETTKPLPTGNVPGTEVDYVTYIRENILGKSNEDLAKVPQNIMLNFSSLLSH